MTELSFIEQHDLLHKIIKQIKKEKTGTPEQFCKKLNITQKTLYKHLSDLKDFDCPVAYSRKRKTYFFINGCELRNFREDY